MELIEVIADKGGELRTLKDELGMSWALSDRHCWNGCLRWSRDTEGNVCCDPKKADEVQCDAICRSKLTRHEQHWRRVGQRMTTLGIYERENNGG